MTEPSDRGIARSRQRPRVDVGVHVEGEIDRLPETLRRLHRLPTPMLRVLVLVDQGVGGVPCDRWVIPVPGGGAAALNTLIRVSTAPIIVLLENGARPASQALDRLVRAIGPAVATAGPSTNLAWNEQREPNAPAPEAGDEEIERFARSLAMRPRARPHELAPLYSLADFCYVARRDVLLRLGGADEAFDPGPCWEMDLNVRASRAGYRGLWVPTAYVHRAQIPTRRLEREAALLTRAKQLYQDRNCGLRLRGEASAYRAHCLGDACPDFAPRGLISSVRAVPPRFEGPLVGRLHDDPTVSCIMPTRDRPRFVIEAVKGFLAQDYPHRELIVVDDGDTSIGALLPEDDRIVSIRLRERLSVGEKRNLACARARGTLIAHVDDDDWYPPDRLRTQVEALRRRGALIAGTSRVYFLDPRQGGGAWLYARPDRGWVAGNTLLYHRSYWQDNPFAPVFVGEDSRFLTQASAGAIADLEDPRLCVATLHGRNTSPKRPEAPLWRPVAADPVRRLLGDRLRHYRDALDATGVPLVSCVMPTFNRPAFVALALECFESQSYPNNELHVLDDGNLPAGPMVRGRAAVRYHRLSRRCRIGDKRNLGNVVARGDLVCLWDDDDWYSPERVRYQALPILYDEADLTGLASAYWLSLKTGDVWAATDRLHHLMFEGDVAGGTLMYRRSLGQRLRYPSASLAEDAWFIRQAVALGFRLKPLENRGRFIYMRHDRNTWRFEAGSFLDPRGWQRASAPAGFDAGLLVAYQAASRALTLDPTDQGIVAAPVREPVARPR